MQNQTQKTLSLLLSGKSKVARKYAGKHVLVIEKEIVPLKKGGGRLEGFFEIKEKIWGASGFNFCSSARNFLHFVDS